MSRIYLFNLHDHRKTLAVLLTLLYILLFGFTYFPFEVYMHDFTCLLHLLPLIHLRKTKKMTF
jgi:hypothetical protein